MYSIASFNTSSANLGLLMYLHVCIVLAVEGALVDDA
jgi:hypothetical protein